MSRSVFTADVRTEEFKPFTPEALGIDSVDGEPDIHIHVLRDTSGSDGSVWSGVALVEPSTLYYTFAGDETIHVLEGAVRISVEGEDPVELGPGALASFHKGARSTWEVTSRLREVFVLTDMDE